MQVKYYILNGVSTAGKDTFVNMCKGYDDHRIYAVQFSSVGWIKEVAEDLGWDGNKDEKGRNLLSGLKHLLTAYDDIPFKKTVENVRFWIEPEDKHFVDALDNYEYTLVFIDVREPEEINKYKKEFNAKTILIRNPEAEAKITNESDMNVLNYNYDYVIWNGSTLEILEKQARAFILIECGDLNEAN